MAKTLKFSYPMILFIFLFLVAYKIEALTKCETDANCPEISIFSPFFISALTTVVYL
ncbi:Nodule Cysteine-Rich (NCR) secreted peptide [Medicago truncatula]|uniref:Nodule Cysteine-Rich (NCR) secreted peptide n=1 Tax=Medicago truncatula TaxID=3880 RepID=A0A072UEE8_MEDTR|nr:Nodule Cysteine-Rich (NCR) secreted peptide [Medicago truncatula]